MSTTAATAAPTGTTPAPPVQTTTTTTTIDQAAVTTGATAAAGTVGALAIVGTILALVFAFLFSFGAAKLSYDTYGNVLWAILDFFFASVYYPFYALFLHQATPAPTGMLGMGRRRKH